jgi:hypothetical protein
MFSCHLGQHHVTRMTLDQGRDVAVVRPGQEIAFPMARHRPIFNRPGAYQGYRLNPSATGVYRHSDQPAWSDASSASIEDDEAALS